MAEQSGGIGRRSRAFADKLNRMHSATQAREMAASTIAFVHQRSGSFGSQTSLTSKSSQDTIQGLFRGTLSLTKILDPLDFEKYISENQPVAENDADSKLLEFPDDDIEVTTIQRQHRTVYPYIPKDPGADTDPLVVDCVKLYTSDWHVVNRRYQFRSKEEGKPDSRRRSKRSHSFIDQLPKHAYEIDEEKSRQETDLDSDGIENKASPSDDIPKGTLAASIVDLQTCSPDELLPAVLNQIPIDDVNQANKDYRQFERIQSLFSVSLEQVDDGTERRIPATLPKQHFGQRILVKCLSLKLDLDVEPFFASMALYDGRSKKKISENFYFDMNSEEHKKMISKHNPKVDITTLSRAAIFSITYPSSDVFLVIKLEKVFQQGDISEAAEHYIRDTDNHKNKDKLTQAAASNCERLGKYRMPFAWTAIHLIDIINGVNYNEPSNTSMSLEKDNPASLGLQRKNSPPESPSMTSYKKEKGDTLPRRASSISSQRRSMYCEVDDASPDLSTFRPVTLTVKSFFKQESDRLKDDDLFKFLADLRRPTSVLKRLKCIPGVLKLDISPPGDKPPYCLTSELQQIYPYHDGQVRPFKEVEEFVPKEVFAPYVTYKNFVCVYPLNVNFTSRSGSVRNIAVKVQFMSGEPKTAVLECIFGKSSCSSFSKAAWTSITYHNKIPDFSEEIKIKLPASLTEQHHLLFTFYHISCTVKKGDDHGPTEVPIGYTWLPMLKEGQLVLGEFDLPVCMEQLPLSYSMLSPEIQLPGLKWVDGHRAVFNVVVRAISSVHTQDIYIHRFLKNCHHVENRTLPTSPSRLNEGNLETCLKKSVMDLKLSRAEHLVRFLPIVLDKLILLLVRPPTVSGHVVNIGQSAFQSLAKIVHELHDLLNENADNHGRNTLLSSFVTYVFNAPFTIVPSTSCMDMYKDDRPISMHNSVTGDEYVQSKVLSNSNPSLNVLSTSSVSSSRSLGNKSENWDLGHISKVPGNRSSMAESKAGHMKLPLSPPHKKLVHEEIALQWAVATGEIRDATLAHAWFFFELMVKSMAQYLDSIDKFYFPRSTRFPEQFKDDVRALVSMATAEIIANFSKVPNNLAKDLNCHLAFFLYDILSLMDRGYVFNLLKLYYSQIMEATVQKPGLAELRLYSLRIICSHEHYVTLNLPFKMPLFPSPQISPSPSLTSIESSASSMLMPSMPPSMAELSVAFRRQHYLSGLLLTELSIAMDSNDSTVQDQAIDCIADLVNCHDSDTRYDEPTCRARVASLYLPLLGIVMENLSLLHGAPLDDIGGGLSVSVANAIATSSLTSRWIPNNDEEKSSQKSVNASLSPESTRKLLLCLLWVIKNEDADVLKQWWSRQPSTAVNTLLDVLHLCATQFKYKEVQSSETKSLTVPSKPDNSNAKARLEEAILAKGAAREMMARHRESRYLLDKVSGPSGVGESKLRWEKHKTQYKQAKQQERHDPENELKAKFCGCLAGETAMIVLDTLELIVEIAITSDDSHTILSHVLKVLLHCLDCPQSERVLQSMFPTQRSIVAKYPELLFDDDTELIADLCSRLLRHCSSSLSSIRAQASASLYLLMRQNYQIGNNFSRVKMQVTLSLSTLVGSIHLYVNGDHLKRSLKTILTYAETDHELKNTNFPEQVRELVFNLHMILTNTVKMQEFEEDPEMLIDLMYRIAKGYQTSPDLRLTWLQSMAAQHTKLNNHLEAAMCVVHSAALVAEYLHLLEDTEHLPVGCVDFEKVSPNVLEESAISDDMLAPDEEGICTGKYFTESGLLGLLEQAANCFSMAHTYECVNEVYKISLPIYEAGRKFMKLCELHGKLSNAFDAVIKSEGKRMMGTYFRVGFFGDKFGDLDGEEFVYKEPAITKLPEISLRLQSFYKERFGEDAVDVIKDSSTVNTSKLDPQKAYIQLTYVEPYFDEYEMKDRITYFDRHYNIRRFVFSTPFTPSGQAHAESLVNQYKRKTILTVSHAFPYLKTRVNVIHKEETTLTPIQVAIEDIQKKTKELKNAVCQEPPDKKMLQMVLQGSVGTAVNQGPLAMAVAFLSDFHHDNDTNEDSHLRISRDHHKLRLCFKSFVKCCGEALQKNKVLITEEQVAYQKELKKNYRSLHEQLDPLLRNRFGTLRGSVGMRKKESAALKKIAMGCASSLTTASTA